MKENFKSWNMGDSFPNQVYSCLCKNWLRNQNFVPIFYDLRKIINYQHTHIISNSV